MISERNTLKNHTFDNEQCASGKEMEFWVLKNAVLQNVGLKAEVMAVTCQCSIGGNLVLSTGLIMWIGHRKKI